MSTLVRERASTDESGASRSESPSVELREVRKAFGAFLAVDGVSLAVRPGEFLTLLGPSGCGKTTTLRMIGGFEYPTSGAIVIDGVEMGGRPPHRRPVNTVFQNYALFPHMSVGQNVGYGLEMARVPKTERRRRVAEALEMVRLPHVEQRKPSELSGGQQQRVALARALVNRPRVLLLDEPLGALDLKLRKAMQLELKALNREVGATFIYVTHDQEEALTMSDRIAVMSEGRILQLGSPDDIYERPRNRFVADFIGQTNFLEGTLVRVVDQTGEVEVPGSGIVRGRLPVGASASGSVALAVRPERVALAGDLPDGPPAGWNRLAGRVSDAIYLGTHTQYVLTLPGGGSVTIHRQNRSAAESGQQIGDEATVVFDPASASILVG
jgi:spermidine/putrescine transport system ATP-binding protein